MIVVTKKTFKPTNWAQGSGISYQNGCPLDVYTVDIEFYFERSFKNKILRFDSVTKRISNYNNIDFDTFIGVGFQVGETIETNSITNPGPFTITEVTDRYLTVSEALTTETKKDANVYVTSKITIVDYFYNFKAKGARKPIASRKVNSDTSEFESLVDAGIPQRLTKSDLNPAVSANSYMEVGTDSFAWLTEAFNGITCANTKIYTLGTVGYQQKFKVSHFYVVNPWFLKDQYLNFKNKKAVDYFVGTNCLSYVFRIEGRYAHTGNADSVYETLNEDALTCWFNQNFKKQRPEYYMDSISYTDDATASVVDKIDFNRVTSVSITMKSTSGKFSNTEGSSTKFIINHLYCPLDENQYQNTQTNMGANFFAGRSINTIGAAPVNGSNYGTDYQAITGFSIAYVDAFTATLTFKINYASHIRSVLKSKAEDDRNYLLAVATEDVLNSSPESSDRVCVLCDFQNANYNQDDSSLLTLVDYLHVSHYPDLGSDVKNNVAGFEGSLVFAEVPFRLETSTIIPTLKNAGIQIVATKAGKQDFVLEQQVFNTEFVCMTGNVQQLNISQSRGYNSQPNDPYNTSFIVTAPQYDSGTKKGFLLHHAFVLRYESWIKLLSNTCPDIQNDNASLSQRWADLGNGWSLKLRFIADVIGVNNYITSFSASTTISIKKAGAAPDSGPVLTPIVYLLDEDGNQVNGVIKGGTTKVIAYFAPQETSVIGFDVGPTADGTLEYTIPFGLVFKRGTLRLYHSVESFVDNADGTLSGSSGGTGTVNYLTGAVVILFAGNPGVNEVTADYIKYETFASNQELSGYLFADFKNPNGGSTQRRIASSDSPSESDSPWSAPEANPGAISSKADGNARLNLFANQSATLESNYTDSSSQRDTPCPVIVIHFTAIPFIKDIRQFNDGEQHLWDDNDPADFN